MLCEVRENFTPKCVEKHTEPTRKAQFSKVLCATSHVRKKSLVKTQLIFYNMPYL